MKRHTLEELHGETLVAEIKITLARSGACRVEGAITDREFALFMLETAREVVNNYHQRAKLLGGETVLVPAYDTALAGTPQEQKLLAVRDQLDDAIRGR